MATQYSNYINLNKKLEIVVHQEINFPYAKKKVSARRSIAHAHQIIVAVDLTGASKRLV